MVAQVQAVQARLIDNPSLYVEQDVLRRKITRPTVPEDTLGIESQPVGGYCIGHAHCVPVHGRLAHHGD